MDHITSYDIEMNVRIMRESIQELSKAVTEAMSNAAKEGVDKAADDVNKKAEENAKKELTKWEKFQAQMNKVSESMRKQILLTTQKTITDLIDEGISYVEDLFKNAWNEMRNMLSYSQMTDSEIRNLKLGYGLSSAQAYGVSQAMSITGISSEEDLYYANTQQLTEFKEAFEKYSEYYENLAESGFFEELENYNYEMMDFKMEMQQEVVKFFVDNKDTITMGMKAIISILDFLTKSTSWMFGSWASANAATTTDALSQYTQTTNNRNLSVSVANNNTFNNVDENTVSGAIADGSSKLYRQIIQALQGGE